MSSSGGGSRILYVAVFRALLGLIVWIKYAIKEKMNESEEAGIRENDLGKDD